MPECTFYKQMLTWIERERALLVLRKPSVKITDSANASDHQSGIKEEETDIDIAAEFETVTNTDKSQYALCINNLTKIYPSRFLGGAPKHSVRGLTLGCREGDRLGLLGVNGAGKSTTLGILTGDVPPTGRTEKFTFRRKQNKLSLSPLFSTSIFLLFLSSLSITLPSLPDFYFIPICLFLFLPKLFTFFHPILSFHVFINTFLSPPATFPFFCFFPNFLPSPKKEIKN